MTTTRQAIAIDRAVAQAPLLQQLVERGRQSAARLAVIRPLLPPGLRDAVDASALDGDSWCLLVPHHAAAAKLRQLLPLLQDTLQQAGYPVARIRIKIRRTHPPGARHRD